MSRDGISKQFDQNIELIRGYLQSAKDNNRPAALLMGAGASVSAGIPLAEGFVDIINKKYRHCLADATDEQRQSYQYCMGKLSLSNRKIVIGAALAKARLNWGHIALAQLIKDGYFSRILTFNFDQLLEQSLSLLGQLAPVYDFGTAPSEETEYIAEPAVIHLHGQGYGIKLIHDQKETEKHIGKLRKVFENTLQTRDMLVIGYSGDSDPYLKLLNDNFHGDHDLLWLNHGDSLGCELDELRQHNQTRIFNSCDFDQTMIGLAKKLGVWPPEFANNPLRHIKAEISNIADYPLQDGNQDEIDILGFLRGRLDEEIVIWDQKNQIQQIISKAFHHPSNRNAIQQLENLLEHSALNLSDDMKEMVAWTFILHGNALSDQAMTNTGDVADKLFEKSGENYRVSLEVKPDKFEALANWGLVLSKQARSKTDVAADALYQQAGEKFQATLDIKPDDHITLTNWGTALSNQAQNKTGVAADAHYLLAGKKFQAALEIKPDLHEVLNNWGLALFRQAQSQAGAAAEALYYQAGEKCQAALEIKPDLHQALNNWGLALYQQAHSKIGAAADPLFQEAIEKFQAALEIKPDMHQALYNWGLALFDQATGQEGAVSDVLFEQVGKKFQAALEIKSDKHEALTNWGSALLAQARTKKGAAADALFEKSYEKYWAALKIKPDDHETLNSWGNALLFQTQIKTGADADALLELAAEKCQRAGDLGLYGLACVAALRGQKRKAISLLKKSLTAGTLPKKSHLEQDSDMNSLRNLKSFQDFMAQLPD